MLRLKFWIGGALVALATAGIAMAGMPGATTEPASATFSATAKRVTTRTCKGSDGTYKITRGVYLGKMESSDPRLNGRMRIQVHSVYNADESAGWMRGVVHVKNEAEGRAVVHLSAVNLDGNVEGLLSGAAGPRRTHLLANFSATFTPDAFAGGKLGTGASANAALFFNGGCVRDDEEKRREEKPAGDEKKERPTEKQRPTENQRPAEQKPEARG